MKDESNAIETLNNSQSKRKYNRRDVVVEDKPLEIKEVNIEDTENKNNDAIDTIERQRTIENLKSIGVLNVDNLTTNELIAKLNESLLEERQKRVDLEVSKDLSVINQYRTNNNNLKDKDFILRLYQMSMPGVCLPAFTDEDAQLTDKQLFNKADEKGMKQETDPSDFYKNRMIRKKKVFNKNSEEEYRRFLES